VVGEAFVLVASEEDYRFSTDNIYTNMAGGPSDRRFSKWYCLDLDNWITGKYKKTGVDSGQEKLPFK
jgi:acyl-homoserine lactone acylase PvdQ